jgi:hypothetical protein
MLDAFAVNASLACSYQSRPVILVDDLVTTGATMGECAAALAVYGFRDIRFLALSRPAIRGIREERPRDLAHAGTREQHGRLTSSAHPNALQTSAATAILPLHW